VAERFVFTITTGRSGTVYLAELLKANLDDASVWHERTGFQAFGVDTPDLSHFTLFNSVGNVPRVNAFWRQKFGRDLETPTAIHAEASHLLAKAGLFENIRILLRKGVSVDVVILKRDIAATLWSFYNRFDFVNNGLAWAFYLDAAYPNVIVNSKAFLEHGAAGKGLWYIFEMRARASYYSRLLADEPGLRFHTAHLEEISKPEGAAQLLAAMDMLPAGGVTCPSVRNAKPFEFFGEKDRERLRKLTERFAFDEDEVAEAFLRTRRRLGSGPNHQVPG